MSVRYITTWRKPDKPLEWDHYVSEDALEAERAVANLKERSVIQFHTYELGSQVQKLSSEF